MSFTPFLQQASAQGSPFFMIITFGLVIVIMYFFMIRPQNKKQKEAEKMIAALKKGDKVVTIGGVHGEVSSTKEKTVIIKVDDTCKIEFSRSAIASVETDEKDEKADKNAKSAKKDKDAASEEPAETK